MIAKMPEVRSESGENNDGLLSPPSVTKSKKRVTIVEEDKDITSGDNVDHQDPNAPDNNGNDPNNNNSNTKNEDDNNQTNSKHLIPMEGDKHEILSALAAKVKIDLKRNQIKDSVGTTKHTEPLEKRFPSPVYKVKLERVLGVTVTTNAGLTCSPSSGVVAYPAGCTVVLYNPRKNRQSHLTNISRKTITSLAFSEDGRYLVTGECGHLPSVRVWDIQEKQLVAEFPGHKFGINVVSFAPNNKYVVSVGSQHDMIVNVWDWKNNVKVASNKVSTKVKAISFAENGNYFVTAGNRHVKFWYLEYSRSKYKEPVPLMGRSAILGEQRNNYFCDVACGRGEMGDSTYAITKSGLLCEFNNRRLLDKWVELRTENANCLSVGEDFIFIGCADGIVRCFSPHTLQFITTLPRTHYLGVDISKGLTISHMASHPPQARYPDATAITYDEQNFKVTVIYNDHSIYVWDIRDIKKVGKSHSFIFHSACIWGLDVYPTSDEGQKPVLPPGSFVTCSSDDTIRIWNLNQNMSNHTIYRRNIYSEDLLKTLYVDNDLNFIKEQLDNSANTEGKETNGNKETLYDQRNGVRCVRISPDGKHLASGDRSGNIRVHELQFMDELCKIEAHDAEVLCLEYSCPVGGQKSGGATRKSLLSSASRDRLIHVFNATRDYSFVTTLDDHSSSITAVRFLQSGPSQQLQMVSCGADKSIIFRDINHDAKGLPEFNRGNHVVGKTTLYDMEVDANSKHILTACQDRNIRVYTVGNGKHTRTFKGSVSEDGTLIKVTLDRSGVYAATSCTDKTLAVYDYQTGECMATMYGHSELVTGLKFTNDCRHLISVSGDGCIFVWRLPQEMTTAMTNRLVQMQSANLNRSTKAYISNEEFSPSPTPELLDPNAHALNVGGDNDYRFSIGKLPTWAKKQVVDDPNSASNAASNKGVDFPKGRWAQRVGSQGITVKSHYDSDSVIPFPAPKFDSDSKESSLEPPAHLQGQSAKDFDSEELNDYNSLSEIENLRGTSPFQGQKKKRFPVSQRLQPLPQLRVPGPNTDDSSLGSYNADATEHDADIDEFSDGLTTQDDGGESTEPEHLERTMYFGQADEKPSEYTVNAMDADELRKSQRRYKKGRGDAIGTTPSQESDLEEEEDDASTPNPDMAERSHSSMFSVSTENVDLVGRRERFLKSNFDSLSGAEDNGGPSNGRRGSSVSPSGPGPHRYTTNFMNNTISNQYREGGSAVQRNAKTIARAQSFRDEEQNRKREELQRRIEETRKKLQNIGYRSMMRGSQSISDLSNLPPEKDNNNLRGGVSGRAAHNNNYYRNNLNAVSGRQHRSERSNPKSSSSKMTRRISRENLSLTVSPSSDSIPSYMKSTSASSKKERPVGAVAPQNGKRRSSVSSVGGAQSIGDLRQIIKVDDDSSSEETNRDSSSHSRRRSNSQDRRGGTLERSPRNRMGGSISNLSSSGSPSHPSVAGNLSRSERDLTKVTKVRVRSSPKEDSVTVNQPPRQRTKMKTTTMIVNEPISTSTSSPMSHRGDIDVVRAPLNWQLAEATAKSLQLASDNLVQLYKRISLDYDLEETQRTELLRALAGSAGSAQHTLRPVAPGSNHWDPSVTSSMHQIHTHGFQAPPNTTPLLQGVNHTNSVQVTVGQQNHNMGPDFQSNPYLQHMIDNYSNMYQNHRGGMGGGIGSGGGVPANPTSPTSSSSTNNSQSGSSNQGPSWL
ncbi:mitogen-activated protein kinase-binding protein 1-like isoform X3 [Tigriopus californicus]|uniref:mitogen-activated protein kinase-binding protein 1-like isoform X3 n=1 Tax=Tigriopus californicus TaxID=6832 RepID=UPI0027D9D3F2|nr:mitogen-activated protein kinase-binding protein 1-like isoform X3 [Tigriopus californicus]